MKLSEAKKELKKIKEHMNLPVIGYSEEDNTHQKILNVGYNHWQTSDCNSYKEMLDWMEENFSPLAKMAVLIGKYNQQVCNGGHYQYHDNAYSYSFDEEDYDLHKELIVLIENYANKTELNQKFLSILRDFNLEEEEEDCYDCGGSGQFEYENENGEDFEYEDCPYCEGTGLISTGLKVVSDGANLDKRYYKINEKVMKSFLTFFEKILK
jgi:hypothetical protein